MGRGAGGEGRTLGELGVDREKCSHWWRRRVTRDKRLAGYWLVTLAGRVTGVGDTNRVTGVGRTSTVGTPTVSLPGRVTKVRTQAGSEFIHRGGWTL